MQALLVKGLLVSTPGEDLDQNGYRFCKSLGGLIHKR